MNGGSFVSTKEVFALAGLIAAALLAMSFDRQIRQLLRWIRRRIERARR